jgi:hypothetical protein
MQGIEQPWATELSRLSSLAADCTNRVPDTLGVPHILWVADFGP